jgi:hypothetical protein
MVRRRWMWKWWSNVCVGHCRVEIDVDIDCRCVTVVTTSRVGRWWYMQVADASYMEGGRWSSSI